MGKICIIGSNSFSGAFFAAHMLNQGYEVLGISRSANPVDALLPYKFLSDGAVDFYQKDLNHQLDDIDKILDQSRVTHIYNFAAQSMVAQSWQYPEHWYETNVVAMVKFHNRLRHKDYLDKYIHVSTPEVYGHCTGLVSESRVYFPSTPYATSRAAADMSLHNFFEAYGFPVTYTRAANVYGEGQQLYRIIPRTILYIKMRKKLQLHGGGASERSFIHMDDVCRATQKVGETGTVGDIYHISTDKTITIKALVDQICAMMGYSSERLCENVSDRMGKDMAYLLDAQKLRDQLDWRAMVSLESGIERCIAWVENNFEVLQQQALSYQHKP